MNNANNLIILKKLYVIIGILYEENRRKNRENKQDSLNELLSHSEMFSANHFNRTIEDPWKGLSLLMEMFSFKFKNLFYFPK